MKGATPISRDEVMPEVQEVVFKEKGPVYVTMENVHLIHEPDDGSATVNINSDEKRVLPFST